MEIAPAVGIDLGTTNSCMAYWVDGQVEVILNTLNETTTPSVVSFGSENYSVGERTSTIGDVTISSEIFNAKRLLGASFMEAKMLTENSPFKMIDDGKNRAKYQVYFKKENHTFYPEQISALVLRKMKKDAEERLGKVIKKAVITVPAYFSDAQKQATRLAAELADLEIIKIIPEPVAATIAFGHSSCIKKERNVLVYDLGGGTFDVAIVNIDTLGFYETLSTNGNTCLGGMNFDNVLYDYCVKDLKKDCFDITSQSEDVMQSLYRECQRVKTALSTRENATVFIKSGEDRYEVAISRKTYEELIFEQVNETINCVKSAIKDAGLEANDIDEIVLVGGSTLTPLIRSMLISNFGDKLNTSCKPHEVVAMGAAILAASLEKRDDLAPLMVRNGIPLSIGLLCSKRVVRQVVKRNTVYPNEIKCKGRTMIDNQQKFYFGVYEGEDVDPAYNRKLGSMNLEGIQIAAAGVAKTDIVFKIDSNGELSVKAIDVKTKSSAFIEIKRPNTFTQEEVSEMALKLIALNTNKKFKHDEEPRIDKKSTTERSTENRAEDLSKVYQPRSIYGDQSMITTFEKELDLIEQE